MDVSRHETGGFGDQLSTFTLSPLATFATAGAICCDKGTFTTSGNASTSTASARSTVIRRMYSASRKCLHSVCFPVLSFGSGFQFSVFFSSEAGLSRCRRLLRCRSGFVSRQRLHTDQTGWRTGGAFRSAYRQGISGVDEARLFWIVMARTDTLSHTFRSRYSRLQAFITTAPLSFDDARDVNRPLLGPLLPQLDNRLPGTKP